MKARLANNRSLEPTTMRNMKKGDLAVITGGQYKGQIVWLILDDTFRIQSLTDRNCYWDIPNDNPVRILEPGEQVILTQE